RAHWEQRHFLRRAELEANVETLTRFEAIRGVADERQVQLKTAVFYARIDLLDLQLMLLTTDVSCGAEALRDARPMNLVRINDHIVVVGAVDSPELLSWLERTTDFQKGHVKQPVNGCSQFEPVNQLRESRLILREALSVS